MKHGIIFDLDGTLVDSLAGIAASLNFSLTGSGLPEHSLAAVRSFVGNGARILVERAAPAGTESDLHTILENSFKTHYAEGWKTGTVLYKDVIELLEELQRRGHPLAVLSNKPHAFTETIVSHLFPSIQFTSVLGQRDGIPHKPDPAGALEIARQFGLAPEDCVLVGDSTIDIQTAKAAGMTAVAVTWGFHDRGPLAEAAADYSLEAPLELIGILDQARFSSST